MLETGSDKNALLSNPRSLSLPVILGIAFVLRLVWAAFVPVVPVSDPAAYYDLARMLLSHGVYGFEPDLPSAKWPPGTAAFYALVFAVPGPDFATAKAINVLISLLNIWLVWAVGRVYFNDMTGRVAALAMAVWPQMIFFTTLLASEPLFICLILSAVLCWERGGLSRIGWLVAAGVFFGLACYVRSVGLLLPIILTLGALLSASVRLHVALARLVIVGSVMAALIAPWSMRNQAIFGQSITMSANFGSTLYMGNGPGTTGRHGSVAMSDALLEQLEGLSQPERSDVQKELAKEAIFADPGAFVLRSLVKLRIVHDRETIGVEWNRGGLAQTGVGPGGATALKLVATAYWWVILLAGLSGFIWHVIFGSGWRFLVSPPVFVWGYFAGIHSIVLAGDRFHMPQAPFIAMIAAAFAIHLFQKWRGADHVSA